MPGRRSQLTACRWEVAGLGQGYSPLPRTQLAEEPAGAASFPSRASLARQAAPRSLPGSAYPSKVTSFMLRQDLGWGCSPHRARCGRDWSSRPTAGRRQWCRLGRSSGAPWTAVSLRDRTALSLIGARCSLHSAGPIPDVGSDRFGQDRHRDLGRVTRLRYRCRPGRGHGSDRSPPGRRANRRGSPACDGRRAPRCSRPRCPGSHQSCTGEIEVMSGHHDLVELGQGGDDTGRRRGVSENPGPPADEGRQLGQGVGDRGAPDDHQLGHRRARR